MGDRIGGGDHPCIEARSRSSIQSWWLFVEWTGPYCDCISEQDRLGESETITHSRCSSVRRAAAHFQLVMLPYVSVPAFSIRPTCMNARRCRVMSEVRPPARLPSRVERQGGLARRLQNCLRGEMADLGAGRWVVMDIAQSAGSAGLNARRRGAQQRWPASEIHRQ